MKVRVQVNQNLFRQSVCLLQACACLEQRFLFVVIESTLKLETDELTGKRLTGSAQVLSMDDLDSLTVVELKERLRAEAKKVSGTKKELILRLKGRESETFLELEEGIQNPQSSRPGTLSKKQVFCSYCQQILNVPVGYEGAIKCPVCKRSFRLGRGQNLESHAYRKQLLQVTLVAFLVAFLAFLNGQRLGGISLFGEATPGAFYSFACGLVSGAIGCFTGFLAVLSWYSKPLEIINPS